MLRFLKIQSLHIVHLLHNYDPGFLALKRSSKTVVAILAAVAIFYDDPRLAMFSAISAMLISRSQTGFTIQERKFTLLLTGLTLAVISVPVSLIAQHGLTSVIFITIASFLAFFLIGLRAVPDFPAIVILSVVVVEMAFSNTFLSGLKFSGIYMITTTLVFLMHFVLFPTRPYKRMKIQLEIIGQNLENYYQSTVSTYPTLEEAIARIHRSGEIYKASVSDFRRLWILFRVQIVSENSAEAQLMRKFTGIEKTFKYTTIIWQFRARSWDSEIYRKVISEDTILAETFEKLLTLFKAGNPAGYRLDLQNFQNEIEKKTAGFNQDFIEGKFKGSREDWMSVVSTFSVIGTLLNDIQQFTSYETSSTPTGFSGIAKFREFILSLKNIPSKLRFSVPAFRFGLRSAIIIGLTMVYYTLFEPNHGYWLVLFAVLLIRPNLGISIKAGRDRLVGTIAGSLAAFGFMQVFPAGSPVFYVGMFVSTFFMVWFLNLDKFIMMVFSLTFLIVSLFMLIFPAEEGIVFLRIGYTVAIVLLIIFLSFLFWPEKARLKFADAIADGILLQKSYFEQIMLLFSGQHSETTLRPIKSEIELHFVKTREFYEAAKNEVWQTKTLNHGFNIKMYIQRLLNTLNALELAAERHCTGNISEAFTSEKIKLSSEIEKAFEVLSGAIRQRTLPIGFPELNQSFDHICQNFGDGIRKPNTENEDYTKTRNLSVFVWNLKPLILELEGIRDEIVLKMNEG